MTPVHPADYRGGQLRRCSRILLRFIARRLQLRKSREIMVRHQRAAGFSPRGHPSPTIRAFIMNDLILEPIRSDVNVRLARPVYRPADNLPEVHRMVARVRLADDLAGEMAEAGFNHHTGRSVTRCQP